METQAKVIGGWATVRYLDEQEPLGNVYFSFGDYDEETGLDTFGIHDDRVFFYATGEDELKEMMNENELRDFVVLDYELSMMMPDGLGFVGAMKDVDRFLSTDNTKRYNNTNTKEK